MHLKVNEDRRLEECMQALTVYGQRRTNRLVPGGLGNLIERSFKISPCFVQGLGAGREQERASGLKKGPRVIAEESEWACCKEQERLGDELFKSLVVSEAGERGKIATSFRSGYLWFLEKWCLAHMTSEPLFSLEVQTDDVPLSHLDPSSIFSLASPLAISEEVEISFHHLDFRKGDYYFFN